LEDISVVLGVIGSDIHSIGNQILEYALRENDIDVTNLGVLVSQKEFIEATLETSSDSIWVSSLYGHGEMDCRGLRNKCVEYGIGDILLYLGGNLDIGKQDWEYTKEKFINMGYDRVYLPGIEPDIPINHLKEDIKNSK